MAFVVSFALGLGPVPFVLVGEMPPREVSRAFCRSLCLATATSPLSASRLTSAISPQAKSATASIAVVRPLSSPLPPFTDPHSRRL